MSEHRHFTEDEFLDALASEGVEGDDLCRTAEQCPVCRSRCQSARTWASLIGTRDVWEETNTVAQPVTLNEGHMAILRGIIALERRTKKAAPDAETIVSTLPSNNVDSWSASLADVAPSSGLAEVLIEAARRYYNRAPRDAQTILDIAERVVTQLIPRAVRLEADLWKERANALRHLSEYRRALDALQKAEALYRQLPVPAYDLAFVAWSRGSIFFVQKRFEQARRELARASAGFRSYSDEVHLAKVRSVEGGILFEEGDIAAAREVFSEVAELASGFDDREMLARQFANLCTCDLRLGDIASGCRYGESAIALFDELAFPTEKARLLWSIGESLINLNRPNDALRYVRDAAAQFEALHMPDDAASAHLDTLAILLEKGTADEVARLASHIAAICVREGIDIDAACAIDYLKQAVEQLKATTPLVRYVRAYVTARMQGKAVEFDPPS
jgi:tetratricopeptide (TPR) repeat protein